MSLVGLHQPQGQRKSLAMAREASVVSQREALRETSQWSHRGRLLTHLKHGGVGAQLTAGRTHFYPWEQEAAPPIY